MYHPQVDDTGSFSAPDPTPLSETTMIDGDFSSTPDSSMQPSTSTPNCTVHFLPRSSYLSQLIADRVLTLKVNQNTQRAGGRVLTSAENLDSLREKEKKKKEEAELKEKRKIEREQKRHRVEEEKERRRLARLQTERLSGAHRCAPRNKRMVSVTSPLEISFRAERTQSRAGQVEGRVKNTRSKALRESAQHTLSTDNEGKEEREKGRKGTERRNTELPSLNQLSSGPKGTQSNTQLGNVGGRVKNTRSKALRESAQHTLSTDNKEKEEREKGQKVTERRNTELPSLNQLSSGPPHRGTIRVSMNESAVLGEDPVSLCTLGGCQHKSAYKWICCETCERWYHCCCVGVKPRDNHFVCSLCL